MRWSFIYCCRCRVVVFVVVDFNRVSSYSKSIIGRLPALFMLQTALPTSLESVAKLFCLRGSLCASTAQAAYQRLHLKHLLREGGKVDLGVLLQDSFLVSFYFFVIGKKNRVELECVCSRLTPMQCT